MSSFTIYQKILKLGKFSTVSLFNNESKYLLGRWHLDNNSDIKCTLANMDSCGDALCGTPAEYKEVLNKMRNKNYSKVLK